jgi:dihydrolipoamide dehydrogenase
VAAKSPETYDVIVVGAGPGGYVAAIRAAQLDKRVCLVDKRSSLGGTCLNIGCIPSKALLDSSEQYAKAQNELSDAGIEVSEVKLNLSVMMKRKASVVKKLTGGVAGLMKANNVDVVTGTGRLESESTVAVTTDDGEKKLEGKAVILATGSEPVELPFLPFDGKHVVSSEDALSFESVPEELLVVGAGIIGLEMGSVWARLGSKVTVIELLDTALPGWDADVSKLMKRELGKQSLEIHLSTKVNDYEVKKGKVTLKAEDSKGNAVSFAGDKALVAVGRRPYTEGLGLEDLQIKTEKGRVVVDEEYRTNKPGIYAIGDIIHGPMLAHKAEDEGIAVAEIIAGKPGHVNYDAIPGVVYTWPEAAMVGKTEQQLKDEGIEYRAGKFPFAANGRALAMDSSSGFVKILADASTDRVLGVHIVGPWASDLISETVTVMEFGGSAEDIARTVHAHPTLTEAVKEAALSVDGRAIHIQNR